MRKMASVQTIRDITPIEGADAIVLAYVNGWSAVVKKDQFQVGEMVVFLEIDSWVPTELAPFLSKDKEPREYLGVKGERLRTMKLRGQLSQGLILPINVLSAQDLHDGDDVSEALGVVKYEPPIPVQLAGLVRGNFPSLVAKTDEERIQNLSGLMEMLDDVFVETEKLHGTSVSFILNENGELEVCSRNLSLKEDENNLYWKLAKANNALEMLTNVKEHYLSQGVDVKAVAIQGEGVGQGIQKGWEYGIQVPQFFMFTIQVNGKRVPEEDFEHFTRWFGVRVVPFVSRGALRSIVRDVQDTQELRSNILKYVEGKSALDGKTIREGSVFRSMKDSNVSFKVVSNQFLLKGGD